MDREFENHDESGADRGRSPRAAPDSSEPQGAGERGPGIGEVAGRESDHPPAEELSAEGGSPVAATACSPEGSPSPADGNGEKPRTHWRLVGRPPRRQLTKGDGAAWKATTGEQRLLILDCWQRSGLPATDFSPLVGVSAQTLYIWRSRFQKDGPAAFLDSTRGRPRGSQLPDLTKRTILMMKEGHPDWGCQRISDMLLRGPALSASAGAVSRVLHEAGNVLEDVPTRPHPDHPREFERAKPNQLWQTDLFTFILKRQNRRVYLVAFMDDQSRFIVGYGLHGTQSGALVLEVLRAAIASYRPPEEILTDNGTQYVTWRGKSLFTKELEKLGVKQVVASPRRPQTLGKLERFWGSLWRECAEAAVFLDLEDARRRIGLYIDHYNFQRPHQGIEGLVPADRYFGAAPDVLRTLKERVAANALDLAQHGEPRAPFYMTGQVGGKSFSVHAEGERVILRRDGGTREEVELVSPDGERPEAVEAAEPGEPMILLGEAVEPGGGESGTEGERISLPEPLCPAAEPGNVERALMEEGEEAPQPGTSPLDGALDRLEKGLDGEAGDNGAGDAFGGEEGGRS
jgi:transposase InsO family protein